MRSQSVGGIERERNAEEGKTRQHVCRVCLRPYPGAAVYMITSSR